MKPYEDANQISKDAMDNAMRSFGAVTQGFQRLATETSDFTKRSYEQSAQMLEKLSQARSLEKVIEIQNEYARSAYEGWVSQATKVGEIYTEIAKESYKPFEATVAKAANAGTEYGRQFAAKADETVQQAA